MITSGNTNISLIKYNGYTISEIYACGGSLVWSSYKLYATYSDSSVYRVGCESASITTGDTKPTGYTFTAMTSAVIGNCCTSIGDYSFEAATSLSSVSISDSVTMLGGYAFRQCGNLANVTLGNGITRIKTNAFRECFSLTSIDLPNSLTQIDGSAFWQCSGLTTVTVPDSVTTIQGSVWSYCSSLTDVEIGSGLTSLGSNVFLGCSQLQSITINATTPPTLAYNGLNDTNFIIYVPDESVNSYKTAQYWSTYASRIKGISEKP